MICILQIAALVYGIVVLATGKFSLTRKTAVTGARARVIGAILACWLPLSAAVGIVLGVMMALNNPGINQTQIMTQMMQYWWVDLVLAAIVMFVVISLAATAPKSASTQFGQPNVPPYNPQKLPPRGESGNPFEPPGS